MGKKVYLASPLGFSEAGRDFMYSKLVPLIESLGFEILDPWKLTDINLINSALNLPYGPEKRDAWKKINKVIGKNNKDAIDSCDFMIAVLDGPDVDSGTSSEIGYIAGKGKKILGYRGDFRLACDNEGSIVNLQVEYFIYLNGGAIATSLDSLKEELSKIK